MKERERNRGGGGEDRGGEGEDKERETVVGEGGGEGPCEPPQLEGNYFNIWLFVVLENVLSLSLSLSTLYL